MPLNRRSDSRALAPELGCFRLRMAVMNSTSADALIRAARYHREEADSMRQRVSGVEAQLAHYAAELDMHVRTVAEIEATLTDAGIAGVAGVAPLAQAA